jgi:hypothetical protein
LSILFLLAGCIKVGPNFTPPPVAVSQTWLDAGAQRANTEATAVEATSRRFRPIVMTSFAFILGVVPLLFGRGAGAASQRAIGTVVFGGEDCLDTAGNSVCAGLLLDYAAPERKARILEKGTCDWK